jgi:hypothetical protein
MAEAIPKMTKAWRVTGYDGFDALKLAEETIPDVADDQVLVKSEPLFLQNT